MKFWSYLPHFYLNLNFNTARIRGLNAYLIFRQIQSNAIGSSFINSSLFVSNVTQVQSCKNLVINLFINQNHNLFLVKASAGIERLPASRFSYEIYFIIACVSNFRWNSEYFSSSCDELLCNGQEATMEENFWNTEIILRYILINY